MIRLATGKFEASSANRIVAGNTRLPQRSTALGPSSCKQNQRRDPADAGKQGPHQDGQYPGFNQVNHLEPKTNPGQKFENAREQRNDPAKQPDPETSRPPNRRQFNPPHRRLILQSHTNVLPRWLAHPAIIPETPTHASLHRCAVPPTNADKITGTGTIHFLLIYHFNSILMPFSSSNPFGRSSSFTEAIDNTHHLHEKTANLSQNRPRDGFNF
jgi:hypothetical protein